MSKKKQRKQRKQRIKKADAFISSALDLARDVMASGCPPEKTAELMIAVMRAAVLRAADDLGVQPKVVPMKPRPVA
jgi:hypothetical protein